jgi:hypothetical protein
MNAINPEVTPVDRLLGDETRPDCDDEPPVEGLIHEAWDLYKHYQLEYSQVKDLSRLTEKYQRMLLVNVAGRPESVTRRLIARWLPSSQKLVKMAQRLKLWEYQHARRLADFQRACAQVEPHYCSYYKTLNRALMDNRRDALVVSHLLEPLSRVIPPRAGMPGSVKRKVYDFVIIHQEGVTTRDVELGLGFDHQQVSPRLINLSREGFIVEKTEERRNKTGEVEELKVYYPLRRG